MSLSAGLTLTDLSDYLAPSQLCIKPVTMVEDESATSTSAENDGSQANMEIMIDIDTLAYYEKGTNGTKSKKLKKAEITLNDCLACSGCITSAESVLVQMQSHEEVYRVLRERPDLTAIISISPQTIASLAALHDLSIEATMKGLRLFFKRELGFRLVFDTTFARSISLSENRREFLERRSHAESTPSSSSLANSTNSPSTSSIGPLPILSSACPGWICYAEKTHGELLPFVSNVKSPQAVMGTLVKGGRVAERLGSRPDQLYHVTVMPCYDKKLEASRPNFATPFTLDPPSSSSSKTPPPVRDVDCVLTTGEVNTMIISSGTTLRRLSLESNDLGSIEHEYFPSSLLSPLSTPHTSTSSGGYLHNVLLAIISSIPPSSRHELRLDSRKLRGENSVQYTLFQNDLVLVRVAKSYGLHNLHTIVKKLGRDHGVSVSSGAAGRAAPSRARTMDRTKKGTTATEREVEFVEVMACPGGCVNGGGQIRTPETSSKQRVDEEGMPDLVPASLEEEEGRDDGRVLNSTEWVARVEAKYWSASSSASVLVNEVGEGVDESVKQFLRLLEMNREEEEEVEKCVEELVQGGGEGRRKELLRTSYRALEKEETNGLAVVW